MKENKYDDNEFFQKYSEMERSKKGLDGAGEWHVLKEMFPDFKDKRVLDLGCGYGWHCIYAVEQGANSATGIDISEKMLQKAENMTKSDRITYKKQPIEDIDFPKGSFDIVISSLAFHYVESFDSICKKIRDVLTTGGSFVFSVEHPVFTAYGTEDWYYDSNGEILHWPVDNYFTEGKRKTSFLWENVSKYHKTLTTYLSTILKHGFEIVDIQEPMPEESMLSIPGMEDELRRPMMLLISARRK